jgi:hypothetical protein
MEFVIRKINKNDKDFLIHHQYEEELDADLDLLAYEDNRISINEFSSIIKKSSNRYKKYLINYLGKKKFEQLNQGEIK